MELEFDGEMKVVTLGENLGVVKMAAMESERKRERERERCELLSPKKSVWGLGRYELQ